MDKTFERLEPTHDVEEGRERAQRQMSECDKAFVDARALAEAGWLGRLGLTETDVRQGALNLGADPDQTDVWVCRVYGKSVTVTFAYDLGCFAVDMPLGVRLAKGAEAEAFTYANFCRAFRYKTGEFRAFDDDGSLSWTAGSQLHACFEQLLERDLDDVLDRLESLCGSALENVTAVATGAKTSTAAIDVRPDHRLRDFLHRG